MAPSVTSTSLPGNGPVFLNPSVTLLTLLKSESTRKQRPSFGLMGSTWLRNGSMRRHVDIHSKRPSPSTRRAIQSGAGDETRTRDFNLGKEAVAGRIQTAVQVNPVRFLPVFLNPFALGFLWSAILFSTAS